MRRPNERRAPQNQRALNTRQRRQQHVLDVSVRARTATQHRRRRVLVTIAKVVLLVSAGVGIYIGVRQGLQRLFFDNPDYRLSQITVQTDGTLQRDQILKAADLHEGENIFSINLSQVHDRLQQLPQVDEVQITRKMPAEIDVHVVERKPIAWITAEKSIADPFTSDAAFLVDARGVLMKQKKLLPEYLGLPLITGCASEAMVAGQTASSFEAKAALDLLRLSTRSFMQTRFQVREIDVSKGYCLLVTDKNHTQVTFGFDNLEAQLQRLEQFLVYTDDSKQELETVNLLVARNIPVTFAKPAAAVINETIDREEPAPKEEKLKEVREQKEPKVAKAKPVANAPKVNTPAPRAIAVAAPTPATRSGGVKLQHFNAEPPQVRKALPAQSGRKE